MGNITSYSKQQRKPGIRHFKVIQNFNIMPTWGDFVNKNRSVIEPIFLKNQAPKISSFTYLYAHMCCHFAKESSSSFLSTFHNFGFMITLPVQCYSHKKAPSLPMSPDHLPHHWRTILAVSYCAGTVISPVMTEFELNSFNLVKIYINFKSTVICGGGIKNSVLFKASIV